MMKKVCFILAAHFLINFASFSQNGYKINVRFSNAPEGLLKLSVYKGSESFSYVIDSINIRQPNQVVTFSTQKKIIGCIYKLSFTNEKDNYVNVVVDNNTATSGKIVGNDLKNISFSDSLNSKLLQFQKGLLTSTEKYDMLQGFIKKYPLSVIALYAKVELAKLNGKQLKAISKDDSAAIVGYLKTIDLKDKRIQLLPNIYSCLFEYAKLGRLNDSSYIKKVDNILKGQNCTDKNYLFYLDWIFRNLNSYQNINLNAAYKYIYNKYLNKEECVKADLKLYERITKKLNELSDLRIGSVIPDIRMRDSIGSSFALYDILKKSKHTLLAFFDPDCDHCQTLMPETSDFFSSKKYPDSVVQLVGFRNTTTNIGWQSFVKASRMESWLNVCPEKNDETYLLKLKVYSNPKFFFIDSMGVIRSMSQDLRAIETIIQKH